MAVTLPLSVRAVVEAVAARLATVEGWAESPFLPSLLGLDPATIAARRFSVEAPDSADEGGRQRSNAPVLVRSRVIVRALAQVGPKGQLESSRAALDTEATLLRALIGSSDWTDRNFQLVYSNSRRTPLPSGEWVRLELEFVSLHYLSLS